VHPVDLLPPPSVLLLPPLCKGVHEVPPPPRNTCPWYVPLVTGSDLRCDDRRACAHPPSPPVRVRPVRGRVHPPHIHILEDAVGQVCILDWKLDLYSSVCRVAGAGYVLCTLTSPRTPA
jgi:hypothetical protein